MYDADGVNISAEPRDGRPRPIRTPFATADWAQVFMRLLLLTVSHSLDLFLIIPYKVDGVLFHIRLCCKE